MDWQNIKVSQSNDCFHLNGEPIFGRKFIEVLKFHAPGLAPVRDESGWYHINASGHELYPEKYSRTFGYYHNRSAVAKGNQWFHLNEKGERAYSQSYAWAGNFQEELCPVRFGNKYFHIDLAGNRIYPEEYLYSGDFKDGVCCVQNTQGLFVHLDNTGKEINDRKFLDLGVFHKSFATAKDERGWHHIDRSGKALYNERYLQVEPFYNGQALVSTFENRKRVIDELGKVVLEIGAER